MRESRNQTDPRAGMKNPVVQSPSRGLARRFKERILHGYCVRFHMGMILAAVMASGVLASKGLLECGIHSLRLRYPLAVLASYLVFLLLVKVWVWYVSLRQVPGVDLGNLNVGDIGSPGGGGGGGGSGGAFHFGGGSSGGGGASDSWGGEGSEVVSSASAPSSSSGSWFTDFSLDGDLGDDGWVILLLLVVLVLVILCTGGYLVYVAPQILPEAAWQAVLASTLTRVSKEAHHGWMSGVLRSTAIPFAAVLLVAGALGWTAHRHCPEAARLVDVFHCVSR
jgi:hypothetical protein